MTDKELKALVAGLAVAQDRTDARLAESAANHAKIEALLAESAAHHAKTEALLAEITARQDRTDIQMARTEALLAEITAKQDRTDAQLARTDAQLAEITAKQARTDAQMAKTDAQMARTDAKLDRLSEMYGGVGNSQGAVAEEFYHNSLKANPVLAGMRFDFMDKNVTRSHAGLEAEFDLLLVNGREVFVVEVKYKAHENDLKRLLDEKARHFRRLFPEHAGRRQRLALAAFHIRDDLKRAALARGVTVLQRKGDVIETLAA